MSYPFDATLKEIVTLEPADFAPVLHLPTNLPARVLNVDLSTISAATDVAFGSGAPLQQIVDLNFQSGPDVAVDARVHMYSAVLHFKYRVSVRSILILLRPKADAANLTGKLTYTCDGKRLEFEYDVLRMWEQPADLFLHGGLGVLPLAPLCKMPDNIPLEEAVRNVIHEIDRRLRDLPDHAQAVRLMTAASILTGLRVDKHQLRSIFDGVTIMHETAAFDQYLEEAELRRSHKLVLRMGKNRFGPPDPDAESALREIQDLDRLERMVDAAFTASSWKELLETP